MALLRNAIFSVFLAALRAGAEESVAESLELLQTRAAAVLNEGDPCGSPNYLRLDGLTRNNLDNAGPDGGEEGIRYENVFPYSDDVVCLVVNAEPGYQGGRPNGLSNNAGKINVICGTAAKLTYTFVDCVTNQPKTVGPFFISFLDLDQQKDGGGKTSVTVYGDAVDYELTDDTTVGVEQGPNYVTFSSTEPGTSKDNVRDIMNMNDAQKAKSAVVKMGVGSSFKVDLSISAGFNNRFVQFTGMTNQPEACNIPADTCKKANCPEGAGCCVVEGKANKIFNKPFPQQRAKCLKNLNAFWCGVQGNPDPPQPVDPTPVPTPLPTPAPTPSPTPPPTRPTTCGNACHAGMVYKKCAFWGDPHYTKTFGAAQTFNQHGFGVKTLAKTQCGSVEVQTVQCPWWHFNNAATVAAGFAMRVGSDVVTVVATTVVNPGGISVTGGNPWTITSSDSCVSLWIKTNHLPPTPSQYYMDMELKVDDPAVGGTCAGNQQDSPTPQNEILFTDAQLQFLCNACRFACPGSLLSTGAVEEQPAPTALEACAAAGIPHEQALEACSPLCEETEDGCDLLEDCALDFCSADGDKAVVQEEVADLKHFEDDDKNDENLKQAA